MEKKRKTRSSLMLFKRRSQLIEQESNITLINLAQLYETFKDNQIDFNLLSSLMKLSKIQNKKNIDKDSNDTLISRVMENMKKKNLFYFFLNFYKIDDNTLIKIIPYLSYEYYKKNSHLFHENDFSNKFYFIIKGFVSFHKNEIVTDSEKNSSIVDVEKFILGPDKYFGELDLIYDQKKSTSAFCKTDCHLITLKKEYIEKYKRYQKIKEEYYINRNKLNELNVKELTKKILEKNYKNKISEKKMKLDKIKGENFSLQKKIKENKKYNELINQYMNIYKQRFCYLSDFLSNYIQDITKLDNFLMEYGANIQGLNYEVFWNKRKKYQMQVINLFREIKKFNFFEKNLWDEIKNQRNNLDGLNDSYRNTVQKVNNKKDDGFNINEI